MYACVYTCIYTHMYILCVYITNICQYLKQIHMYVYICQYLISVSRSMTTEIVVLHFPYLQSENNNAIGIKKLMKIKYHSAWCRSFRKFSAVVV